MMRFDFTNALGVNLIEESEINALDFSSVHQAFSTRKFPDLEFIDLPNADISEIKKLGEYARGFDYFLLLGIGGSALGPRTILEALSPFHNHKSSPKVFIYDNVDPVTMQNILSTIDLSKTLINVVTKSGSTAETMSSFMVIWQKLKDAGLDVKRHIIATTDPEKGNLRKIVNEHSLMSLPIGSGVGGRYSVLCAVGLLLAEAIGVSSYQLLNGAKEINSKCLVADVMKNPAYLMAGTLYLLFKKHKITTTVMLPYSDRLMYFSQWFSQLWGESLGKDGTGLSPYPSYGATDQHSQLQLWMQGPKDKAIVFLAIEDYGGDEGKIPTIFTDIDGISYLGGHSLQELIKTEQEATEIALSKNSVPNITITIPKIDAHHLGALFQFWGLVTAATGFLMGINPFGQPGVEEGKNLTYGMMGKKGFEAKREEFLKYRQRNRIQM